MELVLDDGDLLVSKPPAMHAQPLAHVVPDVPVVDMSLALLAVWVQVLLELGVDELLEKGFV